MLQSTQMNRSGGLVPPAVIVSNLSKAFPGAVRPVLDDLSVSCPAGKITAIVGPSGCGKTTLLRCLCGLETVSSGTIRFDEADMTQVDAGRRGVAMVFQNYALYPAKTVAENIAFPLRMIGMGEAERTQRVTAAAGLVRIEALLDRRPAQLSGGQRQRVGIARAIVRGPRVLLLDEPLSSLDTKLRAEMRVELAALQRQIGATTIYVTHDQTEALALADHLIVLRDGRIEQQGRPETIFRHPLSTFVADFLGFMNLVEGHARGGTLRFGTDGAMSLPQGMTVPDGNVIVGFRAEEIRIADPGPDNLGFTADVVRTELLGSDTLVHMSAGSAALRARLIGPFNAGERLQLAVSAEHIHLFAPDGRRIGGGLPQ